MNGPGSFEDLCIKVDTLTKKVDTLEGKIDILIKKMEARDEILAKGKETINNIHGIFGGNSINVSKVFGAFNLTDDDELPAIEDRKPNPFE